MKNKFNISVLKQEQIPQAAAVLSRVFNVSVRSVTRAFRHPEPGRTATLVAFKNSVMAGVVQCHAIPFASNQEYFGINKLAVADECRQQGIGHALMKRAEGYIRKNWMRGQYRTILLVDETVKNNPASDFYKKMGYGPEKPARFTAEGLPVLEKRFRATLNHQPRR